MCQWFVIQSNLPIVSTQSDYGAIQDKLQTVQEELTKLGETYSSQQQTFEQERKSWTEDKKLLEDTISDMTTSERSIETDRASREGEVRQLEDRAKVRLLFSSPTYRGADLVTKGCRGEVHPRSAIAC